MNKIDVNTKLTRDSDETAREFLERRVAELETLRHNLIWDMLNEYEGKDYIYCLSVISDIQSDLRHKTDEELEKQVAWDLNLNKEFYPLLVDEIPGPTRFERGLETLPCIYKDCLMHGDCWASTGIEVPVYMDLCRYQRK